MGVKVVDIEACWSKEITFYWGVAFEVFWSKVFTAF